MKRASLLDLKLVQAFARVSLARNPITSFIVLIRSLDLLRDFALTLNSETPHKKKSKGLQSGELESQTSSTHTSVWSSWASSASLSWYVRRKVCRLSRLLKLPVDLSLLECVFLFLFMLWHTAGTVWGKRIFQNSNFLMWQWSFESVPEISLPPCKFLLVQCSSSPPDVVKLDNLIKRAGVV